MAWSTGPLPFPHSLPPRVSGAVVYNLGNSLLEIISRPFYHSAYLLSKVGTDWTRCPHPEPESSLYSPPTSLRVLLLWPELP